MERRDYLDFWAAARAKVGTFDAMDDRRIIFGARQRGHGHEYKVLPTVPERDLIAYERQTGLTLPLEFRTYLEAFGAGGAGPDYGIYDFRDERYRKDLSTPFPCREDVWGPDDECPEDDPVWQLPGLVYICNHGCGSESLIQLNGPEPGSVWAEWSQGLMKTGRFFQFYQRWLDETEAHLEQYHRLLAIAERKPPLDPDRMVTLEDIVLILGSDYRALDEDGSDGNRRLYFGPRSAGHVVVNKDDELVHVAIRVTRHD